MNAVAIVDYGAGNLRSVQKALERAGLPARVVDRPADMDGAAAVVLPGVGAFGPAMERLHAAGFVEALRRTVEVGTPLLGLCLGMQVLFETSEEGGEHRGFGFLRGRVRRLPPGVKVPHMGWNDLRVVRPAPLLASLEQGSYVYFVHSYYVEAQEEDLVAATADYGVTFPAVVGRGRIWGCQFHPEKSSEVGRRILANFAGWLRALTPGAS